MKARMIGLAVAFLLMAGGTAQAADAGDYATLEEFEGSVLVDKSGEFKDALPEMGLEKGDRIMVMEGAEAVIEYANGCRETITGSKIITIDQPCQAAALTTAKALLPEIIAGTAALISVVDDGSDGRKKSP